MKTGRLRQALWVGVFLLMLGGCAAPRAFKAGEALTLEGKHDEAVAKFAEAVAQDPGKEEYRLNLLKAKVDAALFHLQAGQTLMAQRRHAEAMTEFRRAMDLDPSLLVAAQEFKRAESLTQVEQLVAEADAFFRDHRLNNAKHNLARALELEPHNAKAQELLARVQQGGSTLVDGIELDVASDKPITLTFKSTKTKEVFNVLSKLSGIRFIFDEDLKEQDISLSLEKATFSQALELLLRMNDLGKKVLNSKTIIIYSNSKDKSKQYDDFLIQTFYLSNIDAKKAVNLLRTMLQLRKIYVHEELNALVLRDRPEVIKLAQQILEAADRGDSEVVLDLELVEVNHTDELKIGPTLSPYSVSVGMSDAAGANILATGVTAGGTTTGLIQSLNNLQTFYSLPTATFEAQKKRTDSETLANPRIRVKNKEKAKVHIGSREPVITVTINGDQTSENIQYVDVGVKLDVEPIIQLDNTVVTKLNLEVSNATRLTALKSGTTPLQISTTNASTSLILKDGEQTIIGGLLRDDDSKSKNTIPFLGDIPWLGDLLTGHSNTKTKREILLSITPHIVKTVDVPDAAVASIWSGGEDDLKSGPNFGSFAVFKPELEEPLPVSVPRLGGGAPASSAPVAAEPVPAPAMEKINVPIELDDPFLIDAEDISSMPADGSAAAPMVPDSPRAVTAVEQVVLPPAATVATAAQSRAYFSGSSVVAVGQEYVLEAMVDEVSGLFSAPLFVTYDSSRLTFVRAEEGDLLKQGGQSTLFTSNVNASKGEILIGYKQGAGGTGVSGGGRLFRLVFKANAVGPVTIGMDRINFRTPAGTRLEVATTPFALEIR